MRFSATSPSSTSSQAATRVPGFFLPASPTWSTTSSRPGTTLNPLSTVSARSSVEILSAPPSSNQCTMSSTFAPPTRAANVFPAARRIRSFAMASAPWSSPSYSSSSLPVMAGSAAYTSDTRGTTVFSLVAIVRRSAFDMTFSSTLIGKRCDTPLRRSQRPAVAVEPGLLARDRRAQIHRVRIMRHDFRAKPVLERRDDLAARGVVLGVRGEHERHVEVQADRVAFDLDVALLHDVEQPHLDLPCEV